ncbi:MAG TPA: nucleotide exchange factor GrpE [Candidatus Acidoferrum sp.]|nr:nucleotide exchange factor GrpE [Candidatus Acidoferrum sp.]
MAQEKKKDMDTEDVGEEKLSVIVDNDGEQQGAERDPEQVAADLARALSEANTKIAELKDQNLRALAETENVRRRVQRDRDEALKFATTGLAKDLLPVADNLRRALDAIPKEALDTDEALRNLATGVEMTERLLLAALERHQVKRIDALGQKFDSNLHQAMFELPGTGQPAGTVVQVLEAGYTIHDRLLRPALVGVAKAESAGGGNGPAPSANGSGQPIG